MLISLAVVYFLSMVDALWRIKDENYTYLPTSPVGLAVKAVVCLGAAMVILWAWRYWR